MLTALFALALLGPPDDEDVARAQDAAEVAAVPVAAPVTTVPPGAPPHRDCDDTNHTALRIDTDIAPARLVLRVFVDPLAEELLVTLHRAQQIALSSEGEVEVELRLVRRELATTALERDVEHFAMLALADLAKTTTAAASPSAASPSAASKITSDTTSTTTSADTPALDVERISHFIQRRGVRGVAATMRRPELRAEAERELGLTAGALGPDEAARRCLQLRLDHDTQWVLDRQREEDGGLRTQPPWLALSLDGATVEWWSDDRTLRETPVHVDAWRRELRAPSGGIAARIGARREGGRLRDLPSRPGAGSTNAMVPASRGLRLGGPGLPHEVVVILGGESDPALQWALPKLLALREKYLGRLAVTVVARDTPEAATLAARLCAARHLDLAQPFLRALLAKVRRQSSAEWDGIVPTVDAAIESLRGEAATAASAGSSRATAAQPDPLSCALLTTEPRTARALLFDGAVLGFDDLDEVEATLRAEPESAAGLWTSRLLEPI